MININVLMYRCRKIYADLEKLNVHFVFKFSYLKVKQEGQTRRLKTSIDVISTFRAMHGNSHYINTNV